MITTNTGAKKLESSDNWREIFPDNQGAQGAHNVSVGAHDAAICQMCQTINGTTNNSGHTINSGEYFIANGGKYKATASIPVNEAWSGSAQAVDDNDIINALNNRITESAFMSKQDASSGVSNPEKNRIGLTWFDSSNSPFENTWGHLIEVGDPNSQWRGEIAIIPKGVYFRTKTGSNTYSNWTYAYKDYMEAQSGTVTTAPGISLFSTPILRKCGNVCDLYVELFNQTPANVITHIATIPEGYRPVTRIISPVIVGDGSEAGISGYGFVLLSGTDGKLSCSVTANGFVGIHIAYTI